MATAIRILHTIIYIVMVFAIGYVVYAGVLGTFNPTLLAIALVLVALECAVFVGNGWKCPLTTVAMSVGGGEAANYSPMVPASLGRYTPSIFGGLFILGLILLAIRWRLGAS
jgi:hypothetical protein